MSYCRFSDADVYMFPSLYNNKPVVICCACFLTADFGESSVILDTKQEALKHLDLHRAAGHNVPEYAYDRLKEEIEEEREDG